MRLGITYNDVKRPVSPDETPQRGITCLVASGSGPSASARPQLHPAASHRRPAGLRRHVKASTMLPGGRLNCWNDRVGLSDRRVDDVASAPTTEGLMVFWR